MENRFCFDTLYKTDTFAALILVRTKNKSRIIFYFFYKIKILSALPLFQFDLCTEAENVFSMLINSIFYACHQLAKIEKKNIRNFKARIALKTDKFGSNCKDNSKWDKNMR